MTSEGSERVRPRRLFGLLLVVATIGAGAGEATACTSPYAATSPWNTRIGPTPTYDPRSSAHITALEGTLSSDPTQYTYPVYGVTASTPLQTVSISGWFSNVTNGGATLVNQRAGTVRVPIPAGAAAAAGSDAQIILLNAETGDEWGLSNLRQSSGGAWNAWNAYHYNTNWSGVPPADAEGRPFFPRGAGVPYLAGLVRPCEIARGRIDHALAFAYDYPTDRFIYPATKSDGDSRDYSVDMPEGARLQLDPTITQAQIEAWGCTGPCLTIARALQEYGMYIIDNSGREKVMMEYEGTASWNGLVHGNTPRPIPLNRFKLLPLNAVAPPPGSPPPPGSSPPAAAPRPCTLLGTSGADVLVGTPRRDVICGGRGNDLIRGRGGDDVIRGGRGYDRLFGGTGGDRISGSEGNDRMSGGAGRDYLNGGLGSDLLFGGPGADLLAGGAGRDLIVSRDRRRDHVNGGSGRDRALVDRRVDFVRRVESLL